MIKSLIRRICPKFIWDLLAIYKSPNSGFFSKWDSTVSLIRKITLRRKILSYYHKPYRKMNAEEKGVVDYLENNQLGIFPYEFAKKYKHEDVSVFIDAEKDLKYVMYENKRLYYKRSMTIEGIKGLHSQILLEQDEDSPHRYKTQDFYVMHGDVVVDVGCAEGIFALSVVEMASKLYLFEMDPEWIEVLTATFEPWENKVKILNKFVSDVDNDTHTTLDMIFRNCKIDFIKADIEGNELDMLKGMNHVLDSYSPKLVLTTYHKHDDAAEISVYLENKGYQFGFSKGYMLFFLYDSPKPPYLRKSLLRASKKLL